MKKKRTHKKCRRSTKKTKRQEKRKTRKNTKWRLNQVQYYPTPPIGLLGHISSFWIVNCLTPLRGSSSRGKTLLALLALLHFIHQASNNPTLYSIFERPFSSHIVTVLTCFGTVQSKQYILHYDRYAL